jgi:hypothetical protein
MAMFVYRTNILIILTVLVVIAGCVEVEAPTDSRSFSDGVIYVSPKGADIFDGTRESPLRTLRAAMLLAAEGGISSVRVAVGSCVGAFALVGGVDILGGLDPKTWAAVPGEYSEIVLENVPITGQGIHLDTIVRGLALRAGAPRDQHRWSAHTLYLVDCGSNLRFEDCRFESTSGKAGVDGDDGRTSSLWGPDMVGVPGGAGACADSIAALGGSAYYLLSGGDGGFPGQPGQNGTDYSHAGSDHFAPGGEGGAIGQPGQDGGNGVPGEDGENGSPAGLIGQFFNFEYQPLAAGGGLRGNHGHFGAGGGGGGGSLDGTGNGGGSGGYAGDSGGYGRGAHGGGHALTVICRSATVVFSDCEITAGPGGDGGTGGNGSPGGPSTPGGPGGTECSDQVGAGGKGGDGGRGGHGGAGAGGHAGWSYCFYIDGVGAPAIQSDCLLTHSQAGVPGIGGMHGDGITRAQGGQPGQAGDFWPIDARPKLAPAAAD